MPLFLCGGPGALRGVGSCFTPSLLQCAYSSVELCRNYCNPSSHQEFPFRKLSFSGLSQGIEKLNGKSGSLNNNSNNKTLSLEIHKCQKNILANHGMETTVLRTSPNAIHLWSTKWIRKDSTAVLSLMTKLKLTD